MSGQPCQTEDDVNRHRNEYLEALELRADIDEMNLQANLVYKTTGQLPPVSQMPDNRTVEQKLKDYELLKNNIVKEIATISSSTFGLMVVQKIIQNPLNINNNLLVFTAQRIKEIVLNLSKIYTIGIKGDDDDAQQMVNFIIKGYNDVNSFSKSVKEYINSGPTNSLGIMDGQIPVVARDYVNIQMAINENRRLIITFYDKMNNEINQLSPIILRMNPNFIGTVQSNARIAEEIEGRTILLLELMPPQGFLNYIQNAVSQIHSYLPNEVDIVEFGREYLAFLRDGYPQSASINSYTQKTRESYRNYVQNTTNYRLFIDDIDRGTNPQGNSIQEINNQLDAQNDRINTTNRDVNDLLTRLLELYGRGFTIDFLRNLRNDFARFRHGFDGGGGGGGGGGPPSSLSSLSSNVSGIPSYYSGSDYGESEGDDSLGLSNPPSLSDYPSTRMSDRQSSANSLLGIPSGPSSLGSNFLLGSASAIDTPVSSILSASGGGGGGNPIELNKIIEAKISTDRNTMAGSQRRQEEYNIIQQSLDNYVQRYGGALRNVDDLPSEPIGNGIRRRGRPKGSGIMIKKPPKAYKITVKENLNLDKGIEPTSKFIKFGKYLINNHKLHNENTLTLKHIGGGNIYNFPSKKISHNLAHVIKIISGGALPHYNDLEKLSEPEKIYLHNVCTKSNIIDKLNIPTPNKDLYEKEIHDFEVLKGEIMSGNDNPILIKKFKLLILKLSRTGQLPKKEVSEILEDLAHLEI